MLPEVVRKDVIRAVQLFMGEPRVKCVWLFGSASRNRSMDWRSDLDFAVQGLLPGQEYELWSRLDEMLLSAVDLVRLEDANPLLKEQIETGIRLYEN